MEKMKQQNSREKSANWKLFLKDRQNCQILSQTNYEKRGRILITKIRKEKGDITTSLMVRERIASEFYEQLDAIKVDNLDEMEKIFAKH